MTSKQQPITRSLLAVAGVSALILMIPLAAMQFTDEVDWKLFDFIVIGILLMAAGTAYVVGSRLVRTPGQRWMVAGLVGLTTFLIWAELAVGIFGTRFAGS